MRKLTVMEFEQFCKENKLTEFIFNLSDQRGDDKVGNCNGIMHFTTVYAFPCPDSVYFRSKHKDNYMSFANVTGIEFEPDEPDVVNTATIVCKDIDNGSGEERYTILVNGK